MGCISSKKARSDSPEFDIISSSPSSASTGHVNRPGRLAPLLHVKAAPGPLEKINEEPEGEKLAKEGEDEEEENSKRARHALEGHSGNSRALTRGPSSHKRAVFSIKFGRLTEGDHASSGWPAWLAAVAGEAIEGWSPWRSDSFERLEKIGQGTYSDVYRARNVETNRIYAVKRIRFDNLQPESVRFMAREIVILRKLDHPNIMKLEGIITSRLSGSIYLVFEYMEHDLAGLLSCPDVKFTDSMIKCYMRQLLSGLEYCHSRGIMHRDIKTSNVLVNNEGILKIADFGLANRIVGPKNKQHEPLTSRVVTLWYRPPELLLGSTHYGEAVDLWSLGCVFAELFLGRPLLKGRTEVEQLHKIFKLCGTPSDEYWRRSKLPLASMFKPQQPYESTLRERCKDLPKSAVDLIETLLSIEPRKRGTASSALEAEYFMTRPYACDPSNLPKYPPNKEIDAKLREEERRKKTGGSSRAQEGSLRTKRRLRKSLQGSSEFFKVIQTEGAEGGNHVTRPNVYRRRNGLGPRPSLKQPYDTLSEASQSTEQSQASTTRSVPVQVSASSGFAWAKRPKQPNVFDRLHPSSRGRASNEPDPSSVLHSQDEPSVSERQENDDLSTRVRSQSIRKERARLQQPGYDQSHELSEEEGNKKKKDRVSFSGPSIHEVSSRNNEQTRQVFRRSRFYQD